MIVKMPENMKSTAAFSMELEPLLVSGKGRSNILPVLQRSEFVVAAVEAVVGVTAGGDGWPKV